MQIYMLVLPVMTQNCQHSTCSAYKIKTSNFTLNWQCRMLRPYTPCIKSMFNFVHSKQWNNIMREHFPQLHHCECLHPAWSHAHLNSKFFRNDLLTFGSAMAMISAYLKKKSTSFTPTLDSKMLQLVSPHYKPNRCIQNADTDTQRQSHCTKKLLKWLFMYDLGYALCNLFPNP